MGRMPQSVVVIMAAEMNKHDLWSKSPPAVIKLPGDINGGCPNDMKEKPIQEAER